MVLGIIIFIWNELPCFLYRFFLLLKIFTFTYSSLEVFFLFSTSNFSFSYVYLCSVLSVKGTSNRFLFILRQKCKLRPFPISQAQISIPHSLPLFFFFCVVASESCGFKNFCKNILFMV